MISGEPDQRVQSDLRWGGLQGLVTKSSRLVRNLQAKVRFLTGRTTTTSIIYQFDSKLFADEVKASKCVMGKREVYRRRAPLAECYNGLDYTRPQRAEPCPCTHYDYR
jgi:hypothetical protein